jgi:prepilin-type N-terminal cleavage/methylation domain-containing protein
MKMAGKSSRGFSLIELVIVVVIIAIIGAIAIPKMSRGAQGAGDSALMQDLSILRSGMDLYNAEHPTKPLDGTATAAGVTAALTQYSDALGNTNPTKSNVFIYGPYVKQVPALPVGSGAEKGSITITGPAAATTAGTVTTAGWLFTGTDFIANLPATDTDAKTVPYNTY